MNLTAAPADWLPFFAIAGSALAMIYLLRRMMRGMNQQDWILMRQARSQGFDLTQPQRVDFVVFAATEETANDLAGKMRREGFEIRIKIAQMAYMRNKNKPSTAQDGWLISGTRVVQVGPETLTPTRKLLTAMSVEQKAAYLGWQIVANNSEQAQSPTAD